MCLTRIFGLAALAALVGSSLIGCVPAPDPVKGPIGDAVTANAAFAVDLYQQLAKEQAEKNLFFSPFSMSVALDMTAEGARGETALQMGKALGFPASLRGTGDSPWDIAKIHTGMATLIDRFSNSKAVPREVAARIARLQSDLKQANGQTAELQKAQKWAEARTSADRAQQLASELNKLLAQVDQYELRLANALWAEKTYPFQKSYLETIQTYYRTGGAFPVDFRGNAEGVRKQINGWVEEQTRDRIKDLIPPGGVDEYTRLVLANAIYFKGEWAEPFDPKFTKGGAFLLPEGKKVSVPLMQAFGLKTARYAACNGDGTPFDTPQEIGPEDKEDRFYPDRNGFAVLEMPYKGDELTMVLLVPRDPNGLASLEKLLTSSNLRTWLGRLQSRPVNAFVPRFKLETDYQMKPVLEKLGMVRAFVDPREPNGAQFDGMSESQDPNNKLYISKVLHKAFVEVNEKGTEAAAATAVIMAAPRSAAPSARPFVPTVRADRPFVFLIRDRKTETILFLGRVSNPS